VRDFGEMPDSGALAAANKRISNILKKAQGVSSHVDTALLRDPAEKALYDAMQPAVEAADAAFAQGQYQASLQALAVLREPVDAFFADVMVNTEDPALKANRLALLASLQRAMNQVADLARLSA